MPRSRARGKRTRPITHPSPDWRAARVRGWVAAATSQNNAKRCFPRFDFAQRDGDLDVFGMDNTNVALSEVEAQRNRNPTHGVKPLNPPRSVPAIRAAQLNSLASRSIRAKNLPVPAIRAAQRRSLPSQQSRARKKTLSSPDPPGDIIELFERFVRDAHFPLPAPIHDRHGEPERIRQLQLQRARIGIFLNWRRGGMM